MPVSLAGGEILEVACVVTAVYFAIHGADVDSQP
jgi:hypothetical protein